MTANLTPSGFRPVKRARHVEEAPCSAGGLHVLRWVRGVIRCTGCKDTWVALDEALREAS